MRIKTNRIDQVCVDLINDGIETEVKNGFIILPLDLSCQRLVTFLSDYMPSRVNIDIAISNSTINMMFK